MRSGRNRARAPSTLPEMMLERSDRRDAKATDEALGAAAAPLRSAKASGVFVHELLERVPLASFEGTAFDAWRARPDIHALFEEALAIHRVAREQQRATPRPRLAGVLHRD